MNYVEWCVCALKVPCSVHPAPSIEPQGNVVPIVRGAWLKAQKGNDARD